MATILAPPTEALVGNVGAAADGATAGAAQPTATASKSKGTSWMSSWRIEAETATNRKNGKLYSAYRLPQRRGLKGEEPERAPRMELWTNSAKFNGPYRRT